MNKCEADEFLAGKVPGVREYGGGDDRYCWYRGEYIGNPNNNHCRLPIWLWDAMCPGADPSARFVQFDRAFLAQMALRRVLAKWRKENGHT